jgi:hypothetical protein
MRTAKINKLADQPASKIFEKPSLALMICTGARKERRNSWAPQKDEMHQAMKTWN